MEAVQVRIFRSIGRVDVFFTARSKHGGEHGLGRNRHVPHSPTAL
jgi:hypothetical protein